MQRILIVAAAAAIGACALDDERARVEAVETRVTSERSPEEAALELAALYEELHGRMRERGVTTEQMQAAVGAGDSERVRALLGMTREEYGASNTRVLDLVARARRAEEGSEPANPDDWDCRGVLSCAIGVMGIAYSLPHLAVGILAVGGAVCAWDNCRREAEPPRKRP
jgi:hypothetical protein